MEEDIYGDLDDFENQFDKLENENTKLKETTKRLEDTVNKFANEINELKKINRNLELNISSLYKTAKAEIDRKDRQISELRKELHKQEKKNEIQPRENQKLYNQYKEAQSAVEEKNRIIMSLNSELENVRKELVQKNSAMKRTSSQIDETLNQPPKKQKMEKEKIVLHEDEYNDYCNRKRRYKSRSRSKSPNYRKFDSRRDDHRSKVQLKWLKYPQGRPPPRENYKYNSNYKYNRYKYGKNYRNKYDDEYFRRSDSNSPNLRNRFNKNTNGPPTFDYDFHKSKSGEQNSSVQHYQSAESSKQETNYQQNTFSNNSTSCAFSDIDDEIEDGELDSTHNEEDCFNSEDKQYKNDQIEDKHETVEENTKQLNNKQHESDLLRNVNHPLEIKQETAFVSNKTVEDSYDTQKISKSKNSLDSKILKTVEDKSEKTSKSKKTEAKKKHKSSKKENSKTDCQEKFENINKYKKSISTKITEDKKKEKNNLLENPKNSAESKEEIASILREMLENGRKTETVAEYENVKTTDEIQLESNCKQNKQNIIENAKIDEINKQLQLETEHLQKKNKKKDEKINKKLKESDTNISLVSESLQKYQDEEINEKESNINFVVDCPNIKNKIIPEQMDTNITILEPNYINKSETIENIDNSLKFDEEIKHSNKLSEVSGSLETNNSEISINPPESNSIPNNDILSSDSISTNVPQQRKPVRTRRRCIISIK